MRVIIDLKQLILYTGLLFFSAAKGQYRDLGAKTWNSTERLTIDYFGIDKAPDSIHTCEIHLLIKFDGVKGKGYSKDYLYSVVRNYMFDDSWIDTTYGVLSQVAYMQAQFDLSEIYTRLLRSELVQLEKLTTKICNKIRNKYSGECANKFNQLSKETQFGRNAGELKRWQVFISAELNRLSEFENKNGQ